MKRISVNSSGHADDMKPSAAVEMVLTVTDMPLVISIVGNGVGVLTLILHR